MTTGIIPSGGGRAKNARFKRAQVERIAPGAHIRNPSRENGFMFDVVCNGETLGTGTTPASAWARALRVLSAREVA
jgi:hypothetical protein